MYVTTSIHVQKYTDIPLCMRGLATSVKGPLTNCLLRHLPLSDLHCRVLMPSCMRFSTTHVACLPSAAATTTLPDQSKQKSPSNIDVVVIRRQLKDGGVQTACRPVVCWRQEREDIRQGNMTGSGLIPARHPVTVELSVVVLQLTQAAEGNEAVLAGIFCAQEVVLPA